MVARAVVVLGDDIELVVERVDGKHPRHRRRAGRLQPLVLNPDWHGRSQVRRTEDIQLPADLTEPERIRQSGENRHHALHALNVATDGADQDVHHALRGLAVSEVALPVDEPGGDLELLGVVDDSDQLLNLLIGEGASTSVDINLSLLADQVGEALANTNNLGHGEHRLSLAVNVGVEHTENVLELGAHKERL